MLTTLDWAPFKPSSDAQLYPIRILEITKSMNKVKADDSIGRTPTRTPRSRKLEAQKAEFEKLMGEVPQT